MSSEGSSGVSTSDSDIEDFLKEIDTKMARIRELCKPFDKSRESFQEYHNRIQYVFGVFLYKDCHFYEHKF